MEQPVWSTGEDSGHSLKNHTQGGVTSKIQSHSFYLVPGHSSSREPGPYLTGAEELKEQGGILPAPSFPAQKTQDTSSFCKLEKGSRQGQCQSCPGGGGGLARGSQWTDQKRKEKVDTRKGRRGRELLINTGRQAWTSDKEEGTHTLQTE